MLPHIGKNICNTIRNAKIICFYWDLTIINHKSLYRLATIVGKDKEIISLTNNYINGSMSFEKSLKECMDILQPSNIDLIRYLDRSCLSNIAPNFTKFNELLLMNDIKVYIIADTFHQLIRPYLSHININKNNIFANMMYHDTNGNYLWYDQNNILAQRNGKCKVIENLKIKHETDEIIMISGCFPDTQYNNNIVIEYNGIDTNSIDTNIVYTKNEHSITNYQQLIDII